MARPVAFASLVVAVAIAFASLSLFFPRKALAAPSGAGAIVVALGDGATPAAEALARTVYRDAALRPTIDDATARVLAGRQPDAGAPPKLRELDEIRRGIAPGASDAASRRLLASLGRELRSALVVAVSVDPTTPAPPSTSADAAPSAAGASAPKVTARVVRVDDATLASVQLTATGEVSPNGAASYRWPDAVATLRALAPAATAPTPRASATPVAPRADGADSTKKNAWSSAWFWAGLGALVTVGVTVFVIANAAKDDTSNVHLQGHVSQ